MCLLIHLMTVMRLLYWPRQCKQGMTEWWNPYSFMLGSNVEIHHGIKGRIGSSASKVLSNHCPQICQRCRLGDVHLCEAVAQGSRQLSLPCTQQATSPEQIAARARVSDVSFLQDTNPSHLWDNPLAPTLDVSVYRTGLQETAMEGQGERG